ncbi:MAG: hypothetical protein ETSY1_20905 [Candidatus Entotheonella factor]|uniref:Uncharacterized protein n=1 Tax=Entotheonella factor TaxID=1429438 RepID=W4LJ31_ENTF1|nr:MAG: hypothetical protein ETSY1_20905 [Candidatus Entotheonella factor]
MAGTLEVTEELCWMPAGWVFDMVLERMAAELSTQAADLADDLLAARTEANGGYLDLRGKDLHTLERLIQAADIAYERIEQEGAQGLKAPEFYEGLLLQFQQFRDMLYVGQHRCMKPL